jgi:hypothetical protein
MKLRLRAAWWILRGRSVIYGCHFKDNRTPALSPPALIAGCTFGVAPSATGGDE